MNFFLREPMGVAWRDQWLRIENAPVSSRLVNAASGREIPHQILHDGAALCRADLLAGQMLDLQWQASGSTPDESTLVGPDVGVVTDEKEFIISNEYLEARFPTTFARGESVPLLSVQRANKEMARARFQGDIHGGNIRILENGPLCARIEILLQSDDGEYSFDIELLAGEEWFRVREKFRGGVSAKGKACRVVWEFTDFAARDLVSDGWPGTLVTLRDAREYSQPFGIERGTLTALGAQTVFGQVGAPWTILSDGDSCIAALVVAGGDWEFPGEVALRLKRESGQLQLAGEANEGRREWLFVCGKSSDWFPRAGESATSITSLKARGGDLSLDKIRRWQLDAPEPPAPLLWTDAAGVLAAQERLQSPAWSGLLESVPHQTADKNGFDENESRSFGLCGTTDSFPSGVLWLQTGDAEAGRKLASQIRDWAQECARRFASGGLIGAGLDAVWLRPLKLCLYWHDLLRGSNLQSEEDAFATRRALLFCAYCMIDRDFFDWQSAVALADSPHSLRRFLLEEDYSDTMGCDNFHSDLYSYIGAVGLAFPEHPQAQAWVEHAERMALAELQNYVMPDGTFAESDNYYQHFLGLIYYLGFALHRVGRDAILDDSRLKAGLEYWIRAQTPPLIKTGSPATAWFGTYSQNPTARPLGQMIPLADCGLNWGGQAMPSFLHHAANFYANRDPELASHLEWTWQRAGCPLAQYSFLIQEMLTQQLDGPPPREYSLSSTELQGHGTMLHAEVNTPRETAIFVSGGRATSHMHFDSGSLQVWHAGVPLIVDAGYIHDEFSDKRQYAGARWKHSTLTFGEWGGDELGAGDWGIEHRAPLRAVKFEEEFDFVEVDLSHSNRRGLTWRNMEQIVSVEASRQILFAKNRYLAVRDCVTRSVNASTWHLWSLSQTEQVEENRVRIYGRFGVDLCLTFLQPKMPRIHVEEASRARHLWINQSAARDFFVVLQPLLSEEKPFGVEATSNGAIIKGSDWTDEIVFDESNAACSLTRNGQTVFFRS